MRKIDFVTGTRPDIIKMASTYHSLDNYLDSKLRIINTGQHWSRNMNDVFMEELDLPRPDITLDCVSSSRWHGDQIGGYMAALEAHWKLGNYMPDIVVVVGDTNTSLAGAFAASRCGIPVAHIESGLRCGNWNEPEEANRVIIDNLSDYLFATEFCTLDNLKAEGFNMGSVFHVGSTAVDALHMIPLPKRKVEDYAVLTLHRPENTDNIDKLYSLLDAMGKIKTNIIFPIHPGTTKKLEKRGDFCFADNITVISPLCLSDFLKLMLGAQFVITDSGGIQEETTALNIPCLTIKEKSSHIDTILYGTNILVGANPDEIIRVGNSIIKRGFKQAEILVKWDGEAGERIADILMNVNYNRYTQ